MGKLRKRFNWKARQVVKNDETKNDAKDEQIQLDLQVRTESYDSCNVLALPSKKEKIKKAVVTEKPSKRPLSKKQQKKLEKILEAKKKKSNRSQLFEELQKVQATQDELALLTSTAFMQTKGLKRNCHELGIDSKFQNDVKMNSIKGSKPFKERQKRGRMENANVVGIDVSSSSEGSDVEDVVNEGNIESKQDQSKDESHIENVTPMLTEEVYKQNKNKEVSKQVQSSQELLEEKQLKGPKKENDASSTPQNKPAIFVTLNRSPEIQAARLALPILAEEQVIMEAISENPVVILCGETGSGKTTQVPQFLYEGGYAREGLIGITEPRRVAAITMSQRVGMEMNLSSQEVSYQIRFEGNVTENTKIKFMTDGVLLKEIQKDFLLIRYSVIIIDEAHERSVYSDILIGLLSRIVPLREKRNNPLKLVIMSATLRVEDFTENPRLFKKPPPVIKVESRQFPVSVHFNKRTPVEDYLGDAYRKICKIHRQLPEGGILVFVTGQQEIKSLCWKLKRTFPFAKKQQFKTSNENSSTKEEENIQDSDGEWDDVKSFKQKFKGGEKKRMQKKGRKFELLPKINLDDYSVEPMDEERIQEEMGEDGDNLFSDEDDDYRVQGDLGKQTSQPLFVLPLYSLLAPDRQAKVFQPPPEGTRLCVVATNVAETSLTIPNIKYVVDTGKVKTRVYDQVSGISAFLVSWTSKASANQRAGRAGRTAPGHCYRLYSSAVFNDEFTQFSSPEITRRPVDDLVLQMKAMYIDKVVNFPFPSPPDEEALKAGEKRLIMMGALYEPVRPTRFKEVKKWEWTAKITSLGRAMACFPVSPRYAKMLALSNQHGLLPYSIAVVAAMTVQEVFLDKKPIPSTEQEDQKLKDRHQQWVQIKRTWAGEGHSLALGDIMVLLKAVGAAEFVGCTSWFCEQHGLRYKAMIEIRKLRTQLTNEVNLVIPDVNLFVDPKMTPPTPLQIKLLRQVILTGFADHIARRIPKTDIKDDEKIKLKNAYQSIEVETPVFIHHSSVLHKEAPEYVVYQEIFETNKLFMRVVAAVEPEWFPVFAPHLCTFSKPLDEPAPRYDVKTDQVLCHMSSSFGRYAWPVPPVQLEFPAGIEKYRWFARFLLEGYVVKAFRANVNVLLSPPVTMIKSWAKLQPRTESFLQALIGKRADSCEALKKIWCSDPKYLLKEYCEWLPESLHIKISEAWPPLKPAE